MAYNILIVDDSQTIRSMLIKTLKMTALELGEIHVAVNGKDALEKLRDNWIDLVMTDLNMPEMTGLELIESMSADGLLDSVPVIVISTDGSEERIRNLKSQGVREYLRKPFTPESISQAISKVLGAKDVKSET